MAYSTPDHIQPHPPTAENIGEWLANMTPMQRKVLRAVLRSGYSGYCMAGNGQAPKVAAARALVRRDVLAEWRTSTFSAKEYVWNLKDAILAATDPKKEASRG